MSMEKSLPMEVHMLDVDQIFVDYNRNPRVGNITNKNEVTYDTLNDKNKAVRPREDATVIDDLVKSIKEHGLLSPLIVVRQDGETQPYMLCAGFRRMEALLRLKYTSIPCHIISADGPEFILVTLTENLQRENLKPWEIADACSKLSVDFGMTHEKIAKSIGLSRPYVRNLVHLANNLCPELRDIWEKGAPQPQLREAAVLKDSEEQIAKFCKLMGIESLDGEKRNRKTPEDEEESNSGKPKVKKPSRKVLMSTLQIAREKYKIADEVGNHDKIAYAKAVGITLQWVLGLGKTPPYTLDD